MGDASLTSGAPAPPSAERRQVSVLFADMVGFTAISERVGEEATFALVQAVLEKLTGAVREQGGSVNAFAGDAIMALFGVPEALEDAAVRACRAALAIHAAVAAAAGEIERRFGVRVAMRVGISSGPAVVARLASHNAAETALGDTVNLASRLQGLAPAGGTVICDATQRLVEWLAETTSMGEREIKGKARPQTLWLLKSVRRGGRRFDASIGRGLSAYIGREKELEALTGALARSQEQLQAVDVVADAGLGKSRLIFEFRKRIDGGEPLILSGNCVEEGQQTPFLPFLEAMRDAFGIQLDDKPSSIALKLEGGLAALGQATEQNLALLLNLFGLEPPEAALAGLDGVLIGLRTRDLLPVLLQAQCRLRPVILILEDIHWIDHASRDILGELLAGRVPSRLLIVHTRRPQHVPSWIGSAAVTTLEIPPLGDTEIGRLLEARLGVSSLPEALLRRVSERAEGNPLFGEELLSFLIQRGSLRVTSARVDFDADIFNDGLPASLQSLLAARADRLTREDKSLLQAASAIGRRFDRTLLEQIVAPGDDVAARLEKLRAQDIVHPDTEPFYVFKHMLLRDTLYDSVLTARRSELHLRIAQALEQRNEGRVVEIAETLAHHYALSERKDLAFVYLAMAGAKSLGTYSLDEADEHFRSALAIYESHSGCASETQLVALLADYALCSNISLRSRAIIETIDRYMPTLARFGDSPHRVLILHHYIASLVWSGKFRESVRAQEDLSAMARRLGEAKAMAYALVSELSVSTYARPLTLEAAQTCRRSIEEALRALDDAYLRNSYWAISAWEEVNRGRIREAREAVEHLTANGIALNDPRSLGYATALKSLIALLSDDYESALELAEQGIAISRAPYERVSAQSARIVALLLLGKPGALQEAESYLAECARHGWVLFLLGPDNVFGVGLAREGRIREGLQYFRQAIARREAEGYRAAADWCRMNLCEVYVEILSGGQRPQLLVVLRNIVSLLPVMLLGPKIIARLIRSVRSNPQFDPNGHFIGRTEMILGLLRKAENKKALAARHLGEARRIASAFGSSLMLSRIEKAMQDVSEEGVQRLGPQLR